MAWPAATGSRPLELREAYEALQTYAQEYGREPLLLLMHAAVPETLRADLLHLIRVNFMPGRADASLEADVLFAPFTTALPGGYWRIDAQVRWHALQLLRSWSRDEPRGRHVRVAELLWRQLEALARSVNAEADPALAEYIEVQRWVALAHLQPADAARAFAQALAQGEPGAAVAQLRLGGIAAAIELPLAGEQALLDYARGLDALAEGDVAAATEWLEALGDEPLQVGDVTLRPAREWLQSAPPGEAPDTDAARRCLLINGREFEFQGEGDDPVERDMVRPALQGRRGFYLVRIERGRIELARLLRLILEVDVVLVDLSGSTALAHLLLGMAWVLRPHGVLAIADEDYQAGGLTAPELQLRYRLDLHGYETTAQLSRLGDLIVAADALGSPVYRAWPELTPPRLGSVPPPLPAQLGSRNGLAIGVSGDDPLSERRAWALTMRQLEDAARRLEPALGFRHLDYSGMARGFTRPAVEDLLRADFVVADWDGAFLDDVVALGVRMAACPYGTLIAVPATESRERWVQRLQPFTVGGGDVPQPYTALRDAVRDHARQPPTPRPNAVYAALPGLVPAQWPVEVKTTSPKQQPFKLFVSTSSRYGELAHRLRRALEAGGELKVLQFAAPDADAVFAQEYARAIDEADAVVALVGPQTPQSLFAMQELHYARETAKPVFELVAEVGGVRFPLFENPPVNLDARGVVEPLLRLDPAALDDALRRAAQHIADALRSRLQVPPAVLDLVIGRPAPELLTFEWQVEGVVRRRSVSLDPGELRRLNEPGKYLRRPPAQAWVSQDLFEAGAPPAAYRLHLDWPAATLPWELLLLLDHGPERLPGVVRVGGALPAGRPGGKVLLAGEGSEVLGTRLRHAGFSVTMRPRALLSGPRKGPLDGLQVLLAPPSALPLRRPPELLIVDGPLPLGAADSGQVAARAELPQLLDAGACCIVVPAWTVRTATARRFVEVLVDSLADGAEIETASAAARLATLGNVKNLDWAAFQVWAPPGYRLRRPGDQTAGASRSAS